MKRLADKEHMLITHRDAHANAKLEMAILLLPFDALNPSVRISAKKKTCASRRQTASKKQAYKRKYYLLGQGEFLQLLINQLSFLACVGHESPGLFFFNHFGM